MAAALREINDSPSIVKLKDDFIIMHGDTVTNASLADAVKMHMAGKKKDKGDESGAVCMTKVFAQIPYSSPVREPSQEMALLLDAETRQILDYGQYASHDQTSY